MGTRVLILALVVACAGPSPSVDGVATVPSPIPGHVRVTAMLHNTGGDGSVALHITLRGPQRIDWDDTVEVVGHEPRALVVDVAAPPGTYTATFTASYPR
jgi:hypothetical protein